MVARVNCPIVLADSDAVCHIVVMRSPSSKTVPTLDPFDPIRSEQRLLDVFMKAADRFDKKHGRSKETALKQLRKEGIVTKSGKLAKRYGG